jgi:hypothetical protein
MRFGCPERMVLACVSFCHLVSQVSKLCRQYSWEGQYIDNERKNGFVKVSHMSNLTWYIFLNCFFNQIFFDIYQ